MTFYIKCKHFDGRDMWVSETKHGISLHLDIHHAQLFMHHDEMNKIIQVLTEGLRPYAAPLKIRLPFQIVIAETATGIWPKALQGKVS